MSAPLTLIGSTLETLKTHVTDMGYPPFRAKQLYHWIYQHRVSTIDEMHNLPKEMRARLTEIAQVGRTDPLDLHVATDGTKKYLYPTNQGGTVETAMIPEGRRGTLCLSTQVGCGRGCTFCQTARQGLQGNLTAGEILNQYDSLPEREQMTNIVYMGMGEPLDNLDATLDSAEIFTDPEAYHLAPRRITLSTVGIHPQLERFLDSSPINLAVSLHNPFPDERRQLMSVEAAHPIAETVRLIRSRREDTSRRVSFEYTMFDGVNDTPRHVDGIAKLLNGLSVRINVIPFHHIEGSPLRATPLDRIEQFSQALKDKGFPTSVRRSRGQDINAACGMLWTRHQHRILPENT